MSCAEPSSAARCWRTKVADPTRCPARCGAEALSKHGQTPEEKVEKPARTHWDMLLERRSEKELEEILETKVYLALQVRVRPQWRASEDVLDLIEGQKA